MIILNITLLFFFLVNTFSFVMNKNNILQKKKEQSKNSCKIWREKKARKFVFLRLVAFA